MYSDRVTSTQSILSECVPITIRGDSYLRGFAMLIETTLRVQVKNVEIVPSYSSNRYFGSIKEPIVFAATTQVSGKGSFSLIRDIRCDVNSHYNFI